MIPLIVILLMPLLLCVLYWEKSLKFFCAHDVKICHPGEHTALCSHELPMKNFCVHSTSAVSQPVLATLSDKDEQRYTTSQINQKWPQNYHCTKYNIISNYCTTITYLLTRRT